MKKVVVALFIIVSFSCSVFAGVQTVVKNNPAMYLTKEVIVRVNEKSKLDAVKQAITKLANLEGKSGVVAKQIFAALDEKAADISSIYSILYNSSADPLFIARKLSVIPGVVWAEPRYVYEPESVPNDPSYSLQWGLTKVQAAEAWNFSQGDTNVVIGIVDTGIDWDHPDLAANIWINRDEIPGNGLDDDNNGYIDDYRGWDFGGLTGTADNDPMEDRPDHGTNVAGIASAVTNNGVGVAGMGYKCKLMAIKTSQDNNRNLFGSPYVVYGNEGIVYAVQNGCRIVNCSWGGYTYSSFAMEIVNYALQHNVLIIAAAGNDNMSTTHYPSGYPGVLSVASTGTSDTKSSFSNFGSTIDVSAPGQNIYNTWMNDTYSYLSGTSMASPLTAGLAGLIASKFPDYSALQIGERIRATCTSIESLNPNYQRMLGKGRINALDAISKADVYSIRFTQFVTSEVNGDGDGYLEPGETFSLVLTFTNYLNPAPGVSIGLESHSTYASIGNGTYTNSSAIATGSSFTNQSMPFLITLASSTPQNTDIRFSVNFSINGISDWQELVLMVNPSFGTQTSQNISVTVTNKGTLGYNDYPTNKQGIGFDYIEDNNLLFEGALVSGISPFKLIDAARDSVNGNTQNAEFAPIKPFTTVIPGVLADMEGNTVFTDANAGTSQLGITCSLKTFSYNSANKSNFVILRYQFRNTGANTIAGFYAGLYTDWDFNGGQDDYTIFDTEGKFGYQYQTGTTNLLTGVVALNTNNPGYYGILNPGGDNGFSVYDGFTNTEKWTAISSGLGKLNAGGGDVSFMTSAGPYTLEPGITVPIGFALVAAQTLPELRIAAQKARDTYTMILAGNGGDSKNQLPGRFAIEGNYPNPFNPSTKIVFAVPQDEPVSVMVYTSTGQMVQELFSGIMKRGEHSLYWNPENCASGVYFCRIRAGANTGIVKLLYLK